MEKLNSSTLHPRLWDIPLMYHTLLETSANLEHRYGYFIPQLYPALRTHVQTCGAGYPAALTRRAAVNNS